MMMTTTTIDDDDDHDVVLMAADSQAERAGNIVIKKIDGGSTIMEVVLYVSGMRCNLTY